MVCAWALRTMSEWNILWPALGSLLLHPLHVHDLIVRKNQPFNPNWNCPRCERILYHWRKVIPQRTNCADFVILCETLIDCIHAHIHALNGFRQLQPTEQQTDPHESQNLSRWPWSSITLKPQQVAEKAETHTHVILTLMVSWNHSSLTWMQGQTQRRQKKIHQKVVNNDINLNRSIVKKHCQKLLKTKHQVMGLDVPRLIGASSSCLIQFTSCKSTMNKPRCSKDSWQTTMLQRQVETLVWKGLGQAWVRRKSLLLLEGVDVNLGRCNGQFLLLFDCLKQIPVWSEQQQSRQTQDTEQSLSVWLL